MKGDAKHQRQRAIRSLVAEGGMHTQDDLVEALRHRGIVVTQATVSRDIIELGLVRAVVDGRMIYTLPQSVTLNDISLARTRLAHLLSEVPLAFGDSSTLLVVRTAPGMANMLCATLDACAFPEVVGTVAGDDTIFIALRSEADRDTVRLYLSEMSAISA